MGVAATSNGRSELADGRVDLHLHSTCSDGRLAPAAVMAAAGEAGLRVAALTDHDTVTGLDEARVAATDLGLEFVPGIELSAYDESGSTHLLGYFIDPSDRALDAHLRTAREDREQRARRIVRKLNELGIGISIEDVMGVVPSGGLIARSHIARALLGGGWIGSYREAFDRLIGAGQPGYVPTQRLTTGDAIALLHGAGGLAVLAHPGKRHGAAEIEALVREGLDGLETVHPDHAPRTVRRLRRLVAELGLLETGGSDWHGPREDGHGVLGTQPVPYEWYERLRAAAGVGPGRDVPSR